MTLASGISHRRQLDFRNWSEALVDVDYLHRVGYVRAGEWDLSQVLDHVGEGLRTAVRGNSHQGPWIIRKFLGPVLLKRIFRQRRMKAGIQVPDWWLPGPAHNEITAIDRFRSDVTTFEQLDTRPFPHPFFGQLSKSNWNELALIHAAHHLSFLVPKE